MCFRVDEFFLNDVINELTSSHVVDKVDNEEGYTKLEMNLIDEVIFRQKYFSTLWIINLVCLVNKIAEKRFLFVISGELLNSDGSHLS